MKLSDFSSGSQYYCRFSFVVVCSATVLLLLFGSRYKLSLFVMLNYGPDHVQLTFSLKVFWRRKVFWEKKFLKQAGARNFFFPKHFQSPKHFQTESQLYMIQSHGCLERIGLGGFE